MIYCFPILGQKEKEKLKNIEQNESKIQSESAGQNETIEQNDSIDQNENKIDQDQLESVHEEKKLSCPICSFSFLSKNALFQHVSNYHGM